tara:strand:+ start:1535 stop:3343 length:1809 start_codon:yes stop_codon:yes gene_type:complete
MAKAVTYITVVTALALLLLPGPVAAEPNISPQELRLRRPIDLARSSQWIIAANHLEGSVSVIDTTGNTFVSETKLGGRLRSLAAMQNRNVLLVVDEQNHKLIPCNIIQGRVTGYKPADTAHTPVNVVISGDERLASVSCLWARQVQIFALQITDSAVVPSLSATIDLPFNPGLQWVAPDNDHLIVADHHGGHLAVISLQRRQLLKIYQLGVHNIRGMALSSDGKHLMLTHQLLNDLAATEKQRVFWGTVLENLVRAVPLEDLLKTAAENTPAKILRISHWLQYPLGEPGNAAGDPGEILITGDQEIFICFSGTSQVAHEKDLFHSLQRHETGRRPIALATTQDESTVYIANYFDDSISVFDRHKNRIIDTLSLGKMKAWTLADQGHALFFNSRLSLDGWYSCHSCHPDGHTNGLLNENMSDFQIDSPKSVLTLLGAGQSGPWAWTGNRTNLKNQINKSIHVTMQGGNSKFANSANEDALVAYLHTLQPAPALTTARKLNPLERVRRGKDLFEKRRCHECHTPPSYTSSGKFDVGIHDEYGLKEFNPPSLLGVSQRNRFFHDNRAGNLEEVFLKYNHPQTGRPDIAPLTAEQTTDLIQFLQTL